MKSPRAETPDATWTRRQFVRGLVGEIDELIGKVLVEIVDDPMGLAGLPGHVDDQIGTHRGSEQQSPIFERMRVAGLAVIGHDNRLVALEPKRGDPGERRVDDAKPHPLAGPDGYAAGNPAVDRHGVANTARDARFHAVAEPARDPSAIVEPPILEEPQQVSINRDLLGFLDD